MKDPNAYLFDFATAAMSVVLALIFDKVAKGVGSYAAQECSGLNAAVGLLTDVAVLLVLVSVLATLSFAHREMSIRYQRGYFMLDLLSGALLLYVSVECTHQAAFAAAHSVKSMVCGLIALALTFVFLVVRALLLQADLEEKQREVANARIYQVMGFHGLGLVVSTAAVALLLRGEAVASEGLLICALFAVFGALAYLCFFWIFKLKIQLKLRDSNLGETET